ncbi:MAG: hypothetical protein AAF468_20750 [Pseudomonadota bacterium]
MAMLVVAAVGPLASVAEARDPIFQNYGEYRFYAVRRHNDIQGVEAIYDDYRRQWWKRYNSKVLLGRGAARGVSDTPECSSLDGDQHQAMKRVSCGSGHIFRSHVTGIAGWDKSGGGTVNELGALGYLGYEHLFSDQFMAGFGVTPGRSRLNANLGNTSLSTTTTDIGAHLITLYQWPGQHMWAWNFSYVKTKDSTRRNGNLTGTYGGWAMMINGVYYRTYDFSDDFRFSGGLDYTFYMLTPSGFVDSGGNRQKVTQIWRGDATLSGLFEWDTDFGDVYIRAATNVEVLSRSTRGNDLMLDLGGAYKINDTTAFNASFGGTVKSAGYRELRGQLRLVSKF